MHKFRILKELEASVCDVSDEDKRIRIKRNDCIDVTGLS